MKHLNFLFTFPIVSKWVFLFWRLITSRNGHDLLHIQIYTCSTDQTQHKTRKNGPFWVYLRFTRGLCWVYKDLLFSVHCMHWSVKQNSLLYYHLTACSSCPLKNFKHTCSVCFQSEKAFFSLSLSVLSRLLCVYSRFLSENPE